MRILGIETSCDETAAAIIEANPGEKTVKLLSNVVATSLALHAKTGGIIPEIAAREQVKYIIPVIEQALSPVIPSERSESRDLIQNKAGEKDPSTRPSDLVGMTNVDIDAIAVTYGPGLIGSLLVGVETAKTLSFAWNKPIIPVNHLIGHIYANFISDIQYTTYDILSPALVLIVSGGHTDLVLMKTHGDITWLGGTRDDAAGEAFDKIGRLLGLPYPAGPIIAKLAEKGNPKAFNFPRPMHDSKDFDFSFSGLKTAVLREIRSQKSEVRSQQLLADICASTQAAIVDILVRKTLEAAKKYGVKSILLSGGVAANEKLREQLILNTTYQIPNTRVFVPPPNLCTDNAAMIATAAFFNNKPKAWQEITADPELYFDTHHLLD